MSDTADAAHRRKLIRAILILLGAALFFMVCLLPAGTWLSDYVDGPVLTIVNAGFWAYVAATTIRDIVRWFNRRVNPPSDPPPTS